MVAGKGKDKQPSDPQDDKDKQPSDPVASVSGAQEAEDSGEAILPKGWPKDVMFQDSIAFKPRNKKMRRYAEQICADIFNGNEQMRCGHRGLSMEQSKKGARFLQPTDFEIKVVTDPTHPCYCQARPQRIVCSLQPLTKGDILGLYAGDVEVWTGKSHYQADLLKVDDWDRKGKHRYVTICIDAKTKGNHCRFISSTTGHFLTANAILTNLLCEYCGCDRLVLRAIREVAAGEEIVVDYQLALDWV
eukprot:Filipodium_phascolosomae@DN1874_c0_g1_i1.p1